MMTESQQAVSTDFSEGNARTPLSRLLRIAAHEGFDVDAFTRTHGVDRQLLSVRGSPIDRPKYLNVVSKLIHSLDIANLGFRSGECFSLGDLGVLGHAILSSGNIAEALSVYTYFRQAFGSVFDVQIFRRNDALVVSNRLQIEDAHLQRYLLENWLLALPSLLSLVPDNNAFFDSVSVPYREPAYSDLYHEVFKCPVFFDQSDARVVLNTELASTPLKYSNATVHALCKNECLKAVKALKQERHFGDLVKDILLHAHQDFPTPAELSARMNMSERTFRRKLADVGTSYNKLLLDVRMQLASEYQRLGDRSIKDIALTLGYRDVASYHRAFKSYFGMTPKRFSGVEE